MFLSTSSRLTAVSRLVRRCVLDFLIQGLGLIYVPSDIRGWNAVGETGETLSDPRWDASRLHQ